MAGIPDRAAFASALLGSTVSAVSPPAIIPLNHCEEGIVAALEEIRSTFEKNLDQPMSGKAEEAFLEIYEMTIKPALAKTRWEGEGRDWVLKQVGKIARTAQAETPGQPISRKALAKAANHRIPLASEACRFGQKTDADDADEAKEEFGIYCIAFVPLVI